MRKPTFVACLLAVFAELPTCANGQTVPNKPYTRNELCAIATKQSGHNHAYLLDQNQKHAKGPIEFGGVISDNAVATELRLLTGYKIIVTPATAQIPDNPPNTGCSIELIRARPLCPKSAAFDVQLSCHVDPGYSRPYLFSLSIPDIEFPSGDGYFNTDAAAYDFDTRVAGTLVNKN